MEHQRIRIAYYCANDPMDKRSWSGITYYMGRSLQRHVGEVDLLGPVPLPYWLDKTLRGIAKINRILFKKEYATKYSALLGRYNARELKRRMRGKQYDCIVAPAASTELSFLDTDLPIIYFSDATFYRIREYYQWEFRNLSAYSKREGFRLERRALHKSSLLIFASHWAADSAVEHYGVPKERTAVRIMGANMDVAPDRALIHEKQKNRTLTLLYLAVEWERKGGPIAFETLQHLKQRGLDVKLIVCGCIPPDDFKDPNMEVIPFLNKNKQEDHDKFVELLSTSHFLLLPTRADCSLLVACESNAYGMPAIATRTGGVPDVVVDGINGYCLPYEARGDQYADRIEAIYRDQAQYAALVESSRRRFEETLNWDRWALDFRELYRQHFGGVPAAGPKAEALADVR